MANRLTKKVDELRLALERMSSRERAMVSGLAAVVLFLVLLGLGYWLVSEIDERQEHNVAMRQAIRDMGRYRASYLRHKRQEAAKRRGTPAAPIELNTYVEKVASAVGVKIDESSETSPVETKHFIQRGLQIKLRKLNLGELATLLKKLEGDSHNTVQITELSVHARWQHHEELNVDLVVTTFERPKSVKKSKDKSSGRQG